MQCDEVDVAENILADLHRRIVTSFIKARFYTTKSTSFLVNRWKLAVCLNIEKILTVLTY